MRELDRRGSKMRMMKLGSVRVSPVWHSIAKRPTRRPQRGRLVAALSVHYKDILINHLSVCHRNDTRMPKFLQPNGTGSNLSHRRPVPRHHRRQ
jgi:hypothetical protein